MSIRNFLKFIYIYQYQYIHSVKNAVAECRTFIMECNKSDERM